MDPTLTTLPPEVTAATPAASLAGAPAGDVPGSAPAPSPAGAGLPASGAGDRLLTPREVAARFRVDPKTVGRWASAGKLSTIRTLGGHRRYREAEVTALLGR